MNNLISCKLFRSSRYVCAYFEGNKIKVIILIFLYIEVDQKGFQLFHHIESDNFAGYDHIILLDTNNENYKIICATKERNNIKCFALYLSIMYYSLSNYYTNDLEFVDLQSNPEISFFEKHECYLDIFQSEFLLCCGGNNIIY